MAVDNRKEFQWLTASLYLCINDKTLHNFEFESRVK